MPARHTALAAAVVAAAALLAASPAAAWRTKGATAALAPACGAKLDALYADHYPAAASSTGGAARPNACKLVIEQALAANYTDRCPDEAGTVACFNVSVARWCGMVEGSWWRAEGAATRASRRDSQPPLVPLPQAAPEAWTVFVKACELFAGTPAAAGAASGRRLTAEGEGEGEGEGAVTDAGQGCFPAFKRAADFEAWLKGEFAETKDYGKASPVALVSVAVFTLLLLAMSAV